MAWQEIVLSVCRKLESKYDTRIDLVSFVSRTKLESGYALIVFTPRSFAPFGFVPDRKYNPYAHVPGDDYRSYDKTKPVGPRLPITIHPERAAIMLRCVRDGNVYDNSGLRDCLEFAGYKLGGSDSNNNTYIVNKESTWFLGARKEDIGESIVRVFCEKDIATGLRALQVCK